MAVCEVCDEPVLFVPIFGWRHMTLQEFDHDVEVER